MGDISKSVLSGNQGTASKAYPQHTEYYATEQQHKQPYYQEQGGYQTASYGQQ